MSRIRVLLIEDNPGDARLLQEALAEQRNPRFAVECAGRLDEGLARLAEKEPDVLLLDLGLPDSQGFDTFSAAFQKAGPLPIVVLSGLDDEELALRAVRAGAQDYLCKGTFDSQLLARSLRHAMERRRLLHERVQAEEAQRASADRLRLLVEQMPALLWTTDLELRFTSTRGSGLVALPDVPDSFEGRSLLEFYALESNAAQAHLRALGGESVNYEQAWRDHAFESHVEPLRDPEGKIVGCLGVALDVTRRKRAEDELRALTRTLEALIEASPLAVMTLDGESRVTLWSPAAERTFGWRQEEVLGQKLPTVPEDKWDEHLALRESALSGERLTGFETCRRDKSGSLLDVRISVSPLRDGDGHIHGLAEFIEDINDRKRAERAIRRLASMPEQTPDPLVELDLTGNTLYANHAARSRFPDLQALGTWHPVLGNVSSTLARFRHGERKSFSFEVRHEQSVYHQMIYYVPDSHLVRVFLHDVTEERRAQELLEREALYDNLTGLLKRGPFLQRLGERLQEPDPAGCAVLCLGLDRFQRVNNGLGQTAGDRFLAGVADRVSACLRPGDAAARLAGDEFAVLLAEAQGPDGALQAAERIRKAVGQPLEIDDHEIFPSVSVGVAPGTGHPPAESLLRYAHVAMQRAKSLGGGCCVPSDPATAHLPLDRLKLENALRRAIEQRELRFCYQPIVRLGDGGVAALEALVRWRHPERGLLPPAEFIPMAEESGLILPLSYWGLAETCERLRRWRAGGGPRVPIHFNVSGRLFADPDFLEKVESTLSEYSVEDGTLVFEITESVLMQEPETAVALLARVREREVRVSIDDFGTGYSSLSYLQRFPIDSLKIDRSFIGRLGKDGETGEILRAVVTLARRLGVTVVGEGVETEEQALELSVLGCDMAQGYLFSRPLEPEAASALLAQPLPWAGIPLSDNTRSTAAFQRPSLEEIRGGGFHS